MRRRFGLALLAMSIIVSCLASTVANATTSKVVISHVQAGGTSGLDQAALQEIVIIYNNSSSDIEITNWCIANKSSLKFGCFTPVGPSVHLWLKAYGHASVASTQFNSQNSYVSDVSFTPTNLSSGSITSSSDSISLIDATNTIIDNLSWSSTLAGGYNYSRNYVPGSSTDMHDTDQLTDFTKSNVLTIPSSSLEEQVVIVDQCPNIDLVQQSLPPGYLIDNEGNCIIDMCPNLSGLQSSIPTDMELDISGICVNIDLCINLSSNQVSVPVGYRANDNKECFVISSPLKVSEMLPNALGKDSSNEFIELYNPTDFPVSLDLYKFSVGIDVLKSYNFPTGAVVPANGYYVLYNNSINFTLNNTASKLEIATIDNQVVDSSEPYFDAKEGFSWALVDGLWQYTNQPTPLDKNLASIESEVEINTTLTPCGPNQYRNPETNRCRSIVVTTSRLKPCSDDQYRSEETGRCRAILGASTTSEKPCPEGQYRSSDTNRCRNIVSVSKVDYPNQLELSISKSEYGLLFLSLVILFIAGYGVFEWRDEILKLYKRTIRLKRNK